MERILHKSQQGSPDVVLEQITDTIAVFKEIRALALRMADKPKQYGTRGLKLALNAEVQLVKFLSRIGYFEICKAQKRTQADQMLSDYVNDKQAQTNLKLLDENQMLRENNAAFKEGMSEPQDLNNSPNWEAVIGKLSGNPRETIDTHVENDDFTVLH